MDAGVRLEMGSYLPLNLVCSTAWRRRLKASCTVLSSCALSLLVSFYVFSSSSERAFEELQQSFAAGRL